MPLDLLFVCTGNICRSPAAAALTTFSAAPDAGVRVGSVGLAALVGAPVDRVIADALAARGVTGVSHRAQQFEPWMAADAGLVLTATADQATQVLRAMPQALRRTFTLREFVRLASQTDVGRDDPHDVVAAAAAIRGRVPTVPDGSDDIADPYRRGAAVARATVAELADSTRQLLVCLDRARRRPLPYRP